jgi:polar amino acid transport system substrate-binding protein
MRREILIGRAAAAVVVTVAFALAGLAAVAQNGQRTVRDGVFSAAQVQRGQKIFRTICSNCHDIEDFTGPGAYFEDHDGKTLWETFAFVSAKMPDDDPGSLEPAEYAAVLAYIFSAYGLPAGEADLPVDRRTLELITITRPKPSG